MWDHWNKELCYGGILQQQIMNSLVNQQIMVLFAAGAQQLPCDALHFLQTPLETVSQYALAYKQLWLESVNTAQQ